MTKYPIHWNQCTSKEIDVKWNHDVGVIIYKFDCRNWDALDIVLNFVQRANLQLSTGAK